MDKQDLFLPLCEWYFDSKPLVQEVEQGLENAWVIQNGKLHLLSVRILMGEKYPADHDYNEAPMAPVEYGMWRLLYRKGFYP